jgi:hypothetical protein
MTLSAFVGPESQRRIDGTIRGEPQNCQLPDETVAGVDEGTVKSIIPLVHRNVMNITFHA